jgi:hypothetical protein
MSFPLMATRTSCTISRWARAGRFASFTSAQVRVRSGDSRAAHTQFPGFGGINMAYQVQKWMKDVEIVCYGPWLLASWVGLD